MQRLNAVLELNKTRLAAFIRPAHPYKRRKEKLTRYREKYESHACVPLRAEAPGVGGPTCRSLEPELASTREEPPRVGGRGQCYVTGERTAANAPLGVTPLEAPSLAVRDSD